MLLPSILNPQSSILKLGGIQAFIPRFGGVSGLVASYQFAVDKSGEESQRKDAKETESIRKERQTGFFATYLCVLCAFALGILLVVLKTIFALDVFLIPATPA